MFSSALVNKRHKDETFKKEFAEILDHWRDNSISKADLECLSKYTFTDPEFVLITEEFALNHGVELVNHRLMLLECPIAVHEYMNRQMDRWIDHMYGDNLSALGSTSIILFI